MLRVERCDGGPMGKVKGLHVQCGQKSGTLGVLPNPDVAVFNEAHQIRQGPGRLKKLPGQSRPGFAHVKVDHAAAAGKTGELLGRTLVVVQQHQFGGAFLDATQDAFRERKVKNVDRAPRQWGQVIDRPDVAVVQAQKLGPPFIEEPGGQGRGKTIGAVMAVVDHQRLGVVFVGGKQQLQG
jgi:hypothetical protein